MFKIMVLMCVMNVQGKDLCLIGDVPQANNFKTELECKTSVQNIINFTNEDFKQRGLNAGFTCVNIGEEA
jgi:hypothetical protein